MAGMVRIGEWHHHQYTLTVETEVLKAVRYVAQSSQHAQRGAEKIPTFDDAFLDLDGG